MLQTASTLIQGQLELLTPRWRWSVSAVIVTTAAHHLGAFERGWANDLYLVELPPAVLVTCPFGSGSVEDCEQGWANSPFLTEWSDVAAVVGSFDGESRENFEDQWRPNQLFAWNWSAVTSVGALFDSGFQSFEDFENAWSAASMT